MPISEDIVQYYTDLSNHIDERRAALSSQQLQEIDFSDKEGGLVKTMQALEGTMLPSRALLMHMATLENVIAYYQNQSKREDVSSEQLNFLKEEIITALNWFKYKFIGQVYAEIDAHFVQSLALVDIGINQATSYLSPYIKAITAWFNTLKSSVEGELEIEETLGNFDDAYLQMQRVQATHDRMVNARQSLWIVNDAAKALEDLFKKVSDISGMSGANNISIEEIAEYKALYQHIQPFITNFSFISSLELADRKHKVPENLDAEICAVLEGTDEIGQPVKMDATLAYQWLSGLGPLSFFDLNLLRENREHSLAVILEQEQGLLSDLGDDDWQYKYDNKNLLVINDVFKQVSSCTIDGFKTKYEGSHRPKFVDNAKNFELSDEMSTTQLFNTFKLIEKNRCEMTFLSQVTDALLEMLAVNHQRLQNEFSCQEMQKISNFVTLLQVYFSNTDAIQIEENLTLTDLLAQFQNYIDKKEPYASLLTDHYIELLEKLSTFLNGNQSLVNLINENVRKFFGLLSEHSSNNFKKLPVAVKEKMQHELQELRAFIQANAPELQTASHVEQCLELFEICLNRQDGGDYVCADAVAWLNIIQLAAAGKLGQLQILSEQSQIDLNKKYKLEVESSALTKNKKTFPLATSQKNQWLIDATNNIKGEIERTLSALPEAFRQQLASKKISETVVKSAVAAVKNEGSSAVYNLSFKLVNDLNVLRDELVELSKEPYHADFYQDVLDRIYNDLAKIDEILYFHLDVSSQSEILIQQIKHYVYLLKGQFPSNFTGQDFPQEKFMVLSKEQQTFFNALPRHWQQKLHSFRYQSEGLHLNIFEMLANLEQEAENFEKLALPCIDENAEAHELCYYWRQRWNSKDNSVVNNELFELVETLQPRPSNAKIKIAALIESMGKDESFTLSKHNKKLMLALNKKKRSQIKPVDFYKNIWQVSVPRVLAALTTFEIENHLSIGSVSEFVYHYWGARKNAMLSKDVSKITFSEQYQMENDKHFSLLTLEHLEKTQLEPKRKALEELKQEKQKLQVFQSELSRLSQFWFRNDDYLSQFLFYMVSRFKAMGDVEYLECRRNILKQFSDLQKSLVVTNNIITTDYLHNVSTIQQKFLVLDSTVRQVLTDLDRKIAVMQNELILNEELITFYQEKHENDCSKTIVKTAVSSNDAILPKEVSQQENRKQKLIEKMANKLVTESFHAIITDEGIIRFGRSSKSNNEISGPVYGGEKSFVEKFNAGMTKAMSIKVQAILNSKELMAKSGDDLKTHLEDHLANEFKLQLKFKFYYLQLEQIKNRVDLFKAHLQNAEWYIENEDSKNAKLSVLDNIDIALSTSCENKEKGIVKGSGLDMQLRFKKVKDILLKDYDESIDDKAKYALKAAAREKLSADMELNWADYSQTLLYIAYWVAKSYRILKGVLFRTRITNQKDVLVDHLVNLVAIDDDAIVQAKVTRGADPDVEDELLQQFQTRDALEDDIAQEIDRDVANAVNADASMDGWGALKRVFAAPIYQMSGINFFNPATTQTTGANDVENDSVDEQNKQQQSSIIPSNL